MQRFSLFLFLYSASCASDYEINAEPVDVDPGEVTECGFTRVDDTFFYEYDCNPVFSTSGEEWAQSVSSTTFSVTRVLGHPFYQMWYVGVPLDPHGEEIQGDYGLGYAVSSDGTDWESAPTNPMMQEPDNPRAWNYSIMDALQVTGDEATGQYVMLYQGANTEDAFNTLWGLGVATSPDAQVWTELDTNPAIDLTAGIQGVSSWCWPLGLSLGAVTGYTGYIAGSARADGPCEAYSINAPDVNQWQPSSDLFFGAGPQNAWDDQGSLSLAIAELNNTQYMFYVGFGDWELHTGEGYKSTKNQYLGFATSSDGTNWTRDPDPVPVNRTPEGNVSAVAAYTVGSRIHLWITDDYDGIAAVGYYLYDPNRESSDTGAASEE